jgi:protocatechuate 3,4-dioxygenase beta subunit
MKNLNKSAEIKAVKRKICVWIWFLCILTYDAAGQLTCAVKVMDSKAEPVVGAEVAVYEEFYDYSGGEDYAKVLDKIKKTDANGYCVLNANICSRYNVFIVARKKGLALGWDVLDYSRSDESQGNFNIILESPCVLAGVVVDEAGNPVAGAKIQAVPKTSYLRRLEQRPVLAPEQWFTTQTDAKGNFSFHNFAADVSTDFWAEAPGKGSVYEYTTHWTSSCGFEAGRTDIRLVLPQEVAIRGRVVDAESGSPVAGAHVLIKPDNIKEHKNPYCPNQTISGQNGQFNFEGVPPGKHYINLSAPQTTELVDKRIRFDVQASEDFKEIKVALDKGGLIEIAAREEETKKPVSNLPIYFWQAIQDDHSNFYKYSITRKDGRSRIWAPPGECKLSARYDRYFPQDYENQVIVTKGKTTRLEIFLDSYPSVSGLVLDETGQPKAGVLVKAYPAGETMLTDADGKFEVCFDPKTPCEGLIARHIEHNLTAVVNIKDYSKLVKVVLKPALSITGKVTDPKGIGIPAVRLALWLRIPNMLTPCGSEIITDSQGRYDMRAIPPEETEFEYRISVNSSGYGNKQYERISITGEPGTEVEMKTLVLEPADQSISGVVVDAEGKTVARAPIFMRGNNQPTRNTATDNNGRFTIKRICKGPLRIQANFDSNPGGSGSIKAEGGDQNVKIILGQQRVHTRHISLMGKQLPNLEDLKIDILSTDTDDKMMLVCFFDMDQRPSRNCILQLTKQAEQLKQKRIAIAAVQASKVDKNKLDEWVKKFNIPFTVGMINGDVEKIRFAWGVRALPWLILTDKQHVVCVEGFSINELDEKIKTLTEK